MIIRRPEIKKGMPYPNPYQRNLCFFQGQKSIFEVNGQKKMLLGPKGGAHSVVKFPIKCNYKEVSYWLGIPNWWNWQGS